jgi:HTH-type transcriptional regulator/antitoxin HigA
VRFDTCDDSVPHKYAQLAASAVTAAADDVTVRVLHGGVEVARHARCWGRRLKQQLTAGSTDIAIDEGWLRSESGLSIQRTIGLKAKTSFENAPPPKRVELPGEGWAPRSSEPDSYRSEGGQAARSATVQSSEPALPRKDREPFIEVSVPAPAPASALTGALSGQELPYQLGLSARASITLGFVNTLFDATIGPLVNAGIDLVNDNAGTSVPHLNTSASLQNNLLHSLPAPRDSKERVIQSIARGMAGGGATAKAALFVSKAASSAVTRAVAEQMGNASLQAITSAGTSGGASSVVREAGGGPVAQIAAGVVGAAAPVGIAAAVSRSAPAAVVARAQPLAPPQFKPTAATTLLESECGTAIRQGHVKGQLHDVAHVRAFVEGKLSQVTKGMDEAGEIADPATRKAVLDQVVRSSGLSDKYIDALRSDLEAFQKSIPSRPEVARPPVVAVEDAKQPLLSWFKEVEKATWRSPAEVKKLYGSADFEDLWDARPGSEAHDSLEVLALLVEDYERRTFPLEEPDPVAAIRFRLEQAGMEHKDLVSILGSRSRVSEVMNHKRGLTMKMIRKLFDEPHQPTGTPLGPLTHTVAWWPGHTLAAGWSR